MSLLDILLNMAFFTPYMAFGGKKKMQKIDPPKFEGERPYSGAQVGLSADQLKPLAEQYTRQISERSRGEGLVGFDPKHRELLRDVYLTNLMEQEDERKRQDQSQAASQGLRGGIPMDISRRRGQDFDRTRFLGLADIDIADLEARRQDINQATYAQPELVNLGANIQGNRASFDESVWRGEMPTYVDNGGSNIWSSLIGAAGTIGGAMLGKPTLGAAAGGAASRLFSGGSPNRSINQTQRSAEVFNPQLMNRLTWRSGY